MAFAHNIANASLLIRLEPTSRRSTTFDFSTRSFTCQLLERVEHVSLVTSICPLQSTFNSVPFTHRSSLFVLSVNMLLHHTFSLHFALLRLWLCLLSWPSSVSSTLECTGFALSLSHIVGMHTISFTQSCTSISKPELLRRAIKLLKTTGHGIC